MIREAVSVMALLCCVSAASAQPKGDQPAPPPNKVVSMVVYGDDPCPTGDSGEIVVCSRQPESERYRVPKEMRKPPKQPAQRSWKERNEAVEDATRASRPNSCSPVGSNGQTGCTAAMLRQWQAEQRAKKAEAEAASGGVAQ